MRNELANLPVALRPVAETKGLAEERVAEVILENTERLYGETL